MHWRIGNCALLAALLILPSAAAQPPDTEEWLQLFNGRDLQGWIPKIRGHAAGENFADTFRVVDGVLQVAYEDYVGPFRERFGHLFYERPFSHYRLAVEYRFVGEQAVGGPVWAVRNSGIMLHGPPAASMGRDQDFPISIEVQLVGGDGERQRPTLNLCTPGTHVVIQGRLVKQHCVPSRAQTYHGDQWVRIEVLVLGGAVIRHFSGDDVVLEYEMPQIGGGNVAGHDPAVKRDGEVLEGGYIALQAESHPVEFRRIELLDLSGCMDPDAPNYKRYFVKSEPASCRAGEQERR